MAKNTKIAAAKNDTAANLGFEAKLKPHDLRHGVAMEVYEQHRDLEQVRGLLGHTRIETTQLYAQIRPAALKHAVEFYEAKALNVLSS